MTAITRLKNIKHLRVLIYIMINLYSLNCFFLNRSLFFSDNGPKPRIEKASLDGQNREVIVYRGLLRVRSLTVDTDKNKLYWADFDKYTLEGCDYDGSNRRVIRRMDSISMTGIAYYQVNI